MWHQNGFIFIEDGVSRWYGTEVRPGTVAHLQFGGPCRYNSSSCDDSGRNLMIERTPPTMNARPKKVSEGAESKVLRAMCSRTCGTRRSRLDVPSRVAVDCGKPYLPFLGPRQETRRSQKWSANHHTRSLVTTRETEPQASPHYLDVRQSSVMVATQSEISWPNRRCCSANHCGEKM